MNELLRPPFRCDGGYFYDGNDDCFGKLRLWSLDFGKFIVEAMNEKHERDFGEPMRWIWKKDEPCYGAELDAFYLLTCPKCEDDVSGPCTDPENHSLYFDYCPHCGQRLLPPEEGRTE
jgi:hypothetical protein